MKFMNLIKFLLPAAQPMYVFGIGGGGKSNPPPADPAPAPADGSVDPNAAPQPNPNVPTAPAAPVELNPLAEGGGLDNFQKVLDTITASNAPTGKPTKPIRSGDVLTPEGLAKLATSQDFTRAIPAELKAKIAESGVGAEIMQAMQLMSQSSYTTSLQHAAMLNDSSIDSQLAHHSNSMESRFNDTLVNNDVMSQIPGADNPLVAMAARGVQEQLKAAYPSASPTELAQMTTKYIGELSKAMNPSAEDLAEPVIEENWDEWLAN